VKVTEILILGILKFAALGIALASTVWGMIRKTTQEDAQGKKTLTPAGWLAVLLAIGSFAVAGASFGFETLAKQARDTEAREKALQERESQRREKQLDTIAQHARDAEVRAANAAQILLTRSLANEQKILTLTAENEQRLRDLALARNVNLRAQENLNRTGVALTQLERVLQPIDTLQMEVELELPLGRERPRFAPLAMAAAAGNSTALENFGTRSYGDRGLSGVGIDKDSSLYPNMASEPALAEVLQIATLDIHFVPEGQFPRDTANLSDESVAALSGLSFTMRARQPYIHYWLSSRTILFSLEQIEDDSISRADSMASVPDLRRATLVIAVSNPRIAGVGNDESEVAAIEELLMGFRLTSVRVRVSGRDYFVHATQLRAIRTNSRFPMFAVSPLMQPRVDDEGN
jgi:hypothetical protein